MKSPLSQNNYIQKGIPIYFTVTRFLLTELYISSCFVSLRQFSRATQSVLRCSGKCHTVQCCQPCDFIPRSWDFFGTLGFSWDFYFKNKTLGFFLGFFRIQKIILNINFLILINLLVRESYPVINIIR